MALFRRKRVASGHADKPAAAKSVATSSSDVLADADSVRPLLRVRLERPDRMPAGQAPVAKPLLNGALIAVAEVYQTTPVRPEHLTWWGMEPEELWTLAHHNMRVNQPPVQGNGQIHMLDGDQYTAAQFTRIDEITPIDSDGVLVWIPAPTKLMFLRYTDTATLITGVSALVNARETMEQRLGGPDAVSGQWLYPDLLWCDGALAEPVIAKRQATGPKHAALHLSGGVGFNEVWKRLAGRSVPDQQGS